MSARRLKAVPLSEITRRKVETLRPDLLAPWGEITVIAGQQGIGKGALIHRLAAEVTRWAAVGLLAEEDSAAAVLKPRLQAAGARIDRCHTVAAERDDKLGGVLLPRDVNEMAAIIEETGMRLLLIDPWTNYVDALHIDKGQVRPALMALRALADEYRLCVLLAAHPVKHAGQGDPLDEIAHASAVTQVARAAYWVTLDPDGGSDPRENRLRLVSHVKHNVTRPGPTLRFELIKTLLPATEQGEPEMDTVRGDWRGESDLSYRDIREREETAKGAPTKEAQTRDWLRTFLGEQGETERPDVIEAGIAAGYAERTINKVAQGIVSSRVVVPGPARWQLRGDDGRHDSLVQDACQPCQPVEESKETDTPAHAGDGWQGWQGRHDSGTGRPSANREESDPEESFLAALDEIATSREEQ